MFYIKIAARDSLLSQKQVEEVWEEFQYFYPAAHVKKVLIKTYGDLDRATSLMHMGKTDFFTREVDELVIRGVCDIAVHSAKDLPEILLPDLEVYAITGGKTSADVIVMRGQERFESLCPYAKVGVSSLRRVQALQEIRRDFIPVDIRGTIHERLALLEQEQVDAVVIAEAALIRLGLTGLNIRDLPGEETPLQGKLAIVGRKDNSVLKKRLHKLHEVVSGNQV